MSSILHLSVKELASAIRDRKVSSSEVVDSYLHRIKEVNPKLNAVVQLCEGTAKSEALKADQALARGTITGPLHGVPMTLKDSFDSAGTITAGGTLGRKNFIPDSDATILSRLRDNGAILLGKTNTPELTLTYETDNLVYGRTNNPFDLQRSSGGSSGGAAAIVAALGSPFDIGSDYGGSLRYPAHCCGVATIKPTSGRVPRTGHILPFGGVLDSFQQVGPIARSVEDLAYILPLITGPDFIDPSIVPMPMDLSKDIDLPGLRIAFHTDNGILPASAQTSQILHQIASILDGRDMSITEARPGGIEESYEIMMALLAADGGASIRRLLKESNTKKHSIPWLGMGEPVDAVTFDALIMKWFRFKSRMTSFWRDYDIILSPVNSFPAPPHGSIRDDLRSFSYTMTYNLTGWPVVVIRGGTTPEGLPIGLQIVAQPWREDMALSVARLIEDELGDFPVSAL